MITNEVIKLFYYDFIQKQNINLIEEEEEEEEEEER